MDNTSPIRPRILSAEDNSLNQKIMQMILERLGYQAELVVNGREAVEAWERGRHDIIFMDCNMPEMDGFSATREIRNREGAGGRTFIVAMTAEAINGSREKCLQAGMDGYLTKPVLIEQVKTMMMKVVEAIRREE
jgi:CheY-like chemotaxis protein